MSFQNDEPRALRLAPKEWLFLAAVILFWACFVIYLGKDTSWDFRNYHWYIPYAYLNDRLGFDVVVAHQASYYNPLIDIPFYWLAMHTPSWFALAVLGALQGANVVPLYILARQILQLHEFRLGAGALALLGQTGGLGLYLFGTHYYDNVLSLFVLTSLVIVVVRYRTLHSGSLFSAAWITCLAGLLTGIAVGLKLPAAPFALGFAAALIAVGGDLKHQATRLLAGGIGGVLGFALFGGLWMLQMQEITGNPLFPYFNQYFHSTLALAAPYRDLRFVPTHFWHQILFPLLFAYDWSIADDLPAHDIRVAEAYVAMIIGAVVWALGRHSKEPLVAPEATRILFAFTAVTYIAWLKVFAIYRYILTLEMLAPLIVVAAIGLLPLPDRARLLALAGIFVAALLFTEPNSLEGAPLGDPYVSVALPKIVHPDKTMVLMTGNAPMGFIVPSLPPQIPVLRIDGWMLQPRDGTGLTRQMRRRVKAHKGDLFLLADTYDMTRAHDAVADYDLAIDWLNCRLFDTNIEGAYQWCPLLPRPPQR